MSFASLGCHDLSRDGPPWLTAARSGVLRKNLPVFF